MLVIGCSESDAQQKVITVTETYGNAVPKIIKTYKESNDKFELVKSISLYENGQKSSEDNYKDGKGDGKWTTWYENGQKWYEGYIKTINDTTAVWNGLKTQWYVNGQKEKEMTFKDEKEDGLRIEYYENGQKRLEGYFKDGKQDRFWTFWYENGKKWKEGTFKDGETISHECWDEDGNEEECR